MRDTTCSVPDTASRRHDCAAPTNSKDVTSASTDCAVCRHCREFIVARQAGCFDWVHAINRRIWCEGERHYAEPISGDQFAIAVAAELIKARAKFPGTKNLTVALAEELGELSKALLDHSYGKGENDAVYAEAVQVAAMAQRVAEEGDPGFPYIPPPLPKRSDFIRELLSPEQQKTALAFLVRIHNSREIVLYAPDFGDKVKKFLDEVAEEGNGERPVHPNTARPRA